MSTHQHVNMLTCQHVIMSISQHINCPPVHMSTCPYVNCPHVHMSSYQHVTCNMSSCQLLSLSFYQPVRLSACQLDSFWACQLVTLWAYQLASLSACQLVSFWACQLISLSDFQLAHLGACKLVQIHRFIFSPNLMEALSICLKIILFRANLWENTLEVLNVFKSVLGLVIVNICFPADEHTSCSPASQ